MEREHHQRLVKEHGRLQQRMENLLEERNSKSTPPLPNTINPPSSHDRSYQHRDNLIRKLNSSDTIYKRSSSTPYDFSQQSRDQEYNFAKPKSWSFQSPGDDQRDNFYSNSALLPRNESHYQVMQYNRPRNPFLYLIMSALGRVMSSSSVYWLMTMLNPQTITPARMELDFGMRFKFNM